MHRAINEIMAIIVHSIIVISDHIVIPGLIRQGKVCQCDLAEIVRDQIVEPLPHLVGAAVGHPGAGRGTGGQAAYRGKTALGKHQDLAYGVLIRAAGQPVGNAASQLGYSFLSVAGYVIEYFTPIQAVWYTFLLSWLMAIFIGLLIYFLNTISSKRYLGSIVSGIIILFSCYVEAFGSDKQLYFSPVSWSTLNQVDVAEKTNHPSFYYCIGVYCGLSLLLIVLLLVFRKRWKMDIDSK